jgi:hypothetical protein
MATRLELEIIAERLRKILDRVDQIEGAANNRDRATETFRSLKVDLEAEFRRMDTRSGQARLSEAEKAFYWPAILDAWADTAISSVRWNSPPARWHTALYEIGSSMRIHLSAIEDAAV